MYRPETDQHGTLIVRSVDDLIRDILKKSKPLLTETDSVDSEAHHFELLLDNCIVLSPDDLCSGD